MEKKKANKTKKRVGILAAMICLLLAVGVTAGTTLAKYVSSADVSSTSATVAKWGYTVSATGDLFGQTYNKGVIQATSGTKANGSDSIDVSANTDNTLIVAPGTGGKITVSVNGTAEVNAQLKYTFDKSAFNNVFLKTTEDSTETYYYPIKWKVGGTEVTHVVEGSSANNEVTVDDIVAAIKTKLQAAVSGATVNEDTTTYTGKVVFTLSIPANTTISNLDLSIEWEWPFETGSDDTEKKNNNEKDTILGQIANKLSQSGVTSIENDAEFGKYYGSNTTIGLGFSIAVEQTQNA